MSVRVTSEVEHNGGIVGGDGAGDSYSFTWVDESDGTEWTTYAYPVFMPDRFADWAERTDIDEPRNWDVETVDFSESDVSEYLMPSLNGYATEAEAEQAARDLAEHYHWVASTYGKDW